MELVKMVRECGQRRGLFTCNFHVSFSRFHWPSPVTHSVLLQWFSPVSVCLRMGCCEYNLPTISSLCLCLCSAFIWVWVFITALPRSFYFFVQNIVLHYSCPGSSFALCEAPVLTVPLISSLCVFVASGLCVWNLLWPMAAIRRSKLQCDCNQAGPYEAFWE